MAIGKISGPMLQPNLERQGVDLAIDGNVLYADVTNRRVGIGTDTPTQSLDVPGNARLANLTITANTITSDTGKINLGSVANVVIEGGSLNYVITTDGTGNLSWSQISDLDISFGNLEFVDTAIQVTTLDGNLNLKANGAGVITANNTVIANVATPIANTDAATKGYVDSELLNFNDDRITSGDTTVLATTSNVTITVDGVLQSFYTTDQVVIDQISIQDATISSTTGDLHLAPATANNKVVFDNTSSITIPSGDSSLRPVAPVTGDIRYNTTLDVVEFWNGNSWIGTIANMDAEILYGDGVEQSFTLSTSATTKTIFVSINGTMQQPFLAYSVGGVDNKTLTFTEVPESTDVIDVRYIGLVVVPSVNALTVDTANVAAAIGTTSIDSFSTTVYRSAKYSVQLTQAADYQFSDIQVIHNGTTANVGVTSTTTGSTIGTFSANISAGVLTLWTTASASTAVKVQKTYFTL